MLVVLVLAGLLLVYVYAVCWRQRHARQCLAHLPTYPQLPLIGSAHYFLENGRASQNETEKHVEFGHLKHLDLHLLGLFLRLMDITETSEKNQLPFVVWMGPYPCLILNDLDDIKTVTNEFVEKPYYYDFAKMWLGGGRLTASAENWKRNIKKLAGTFSASTIDSFQNVFNLQAQKLVKNLKLEAGQGPFNVMEQYLPETTLEAICQIALGVPKISDSIVTQEYYAAFNKAVEILHKRGFNILLHSNFLFGLTIYQKELKKAVDELHRVSETVMKIRQQREDPIKCNGLFKKSTESNDANFKSYLDILLELNAKDPTFTMEQVRNEVDTIILAGQETVATTLFYVLLMIGCHPNVQDKLHAEIKEIFGNTNRDIHKEDLTRMTYCEAVILETLRLYPPAPAVIRIADHQLQLKSCTVPKGVNCIVNIFGVGRSKKYWGPNAEEFQPERFESSSISAMIPFSTGKRACIGKKYTMPILKTMVAYCVRELIFTAEADQIELKIELALRTVSKKLLQVKLRQK